jgi:glycosyltransferase involved in cell wall biosynthesis
MKKKVLHVLTLCSWGGAPQVVYDIVGNLDRAEFSVAIACGTGDGWERMSESGATVFPLRSLKRGISPLNDLRTLLELYMLMSRGHYDVVHCHSSKAGLLGRIAAKLACVKTVYFTAHGWGLYNHQEYGWAQRVMRACERMGAACSDKIICVSERAKEDAIQWGIARADKFIVVRNGVNWLPQTDRYAIRRRLNIEEDATVFGMVGRLAYPKHPQMFLEAAKRIGAHYRNAKFILVGGGPLAEECVKYVEENHLEDNVFLLGERPPAEVRDLLLGFDAFVLASRFEGLPLTIIEAMFAGLPVLASNVGGVGELVQDNKNGFLFAPDDVDELTRYTEYLIHNREERLRMGREGQAIARLHLTAERMTRQYETLYRGEFAEFMEGEETALDSSARRSSSAPAHRPKALEEKKQTISSRP